jgi:hypothetical protein
MTEQTPASVGERLRSSATAFREHTVYDSEGDPLRLIVQADEMDEAAVLIEALSHDRKVMREALGWYGEQARLARLIHSEGDAGRNALAADGGNRARATLASLNAESGQ